MNVFRVILCLGRDCSPCTKSWQQHVTYIYLSSNRASMAIDHCKIMLLADRHDGVQLARSCYIAVF